MTTPQDVKAQLEGLCEALKHIPFFAHFDNDFIFELAKTCELVTYDIGDQILSQGDLNKHLHFLIEGRVSVMVDDAVVAELTDIGDVLGEMSVITQQACAATIIADSEVRVLRLAMDVLEENADAKSDRFKYLLYRVYASVLTKKLNDTNYRARPLEQVSVAVHKLIQVRGQMLDPLRHELEGMAVRPTPPTPDELRASAKKLESFLEQFEALTARLNF